MVQRVPLLFITWDLTWRLKLKLHFCMPRSKFMYVNPFVTNSNTRPSSHVMWPQHTCHHWGGGMSFLLLSIFIYIPHMHTFETSVLIMCLSYSLISQRRQALGKSGRKWGLQFNVWRPAADRPPRSPCTSEVMDTNVPLKENLSGKEKMELPK